MPITISGDGSITGLVAGGLPDATITQPELASGVSGTGPAFSAYQSSAQSALANATFTKIQFQTEEYDTNNNFDNATNYRFTPTVAGYYQINSRVGLSPDLLAGGSITAIYKNGSEIKRGGINATTSGLGAASIVSSQVYMNGSTDYVEIYGYQNCGANSAVNTGIPNTYVNACLVRGA
jgi:hypothetical protein